MPCAGSSLTYLVAENLRRDPFFYPLFERAESIEPIRARAARAVCHPRDQEESERLLGLALGTCFHDAVVIVDAAQGMDLLVSPTMQIRSLPSCATISSTFLK